MYLQPSLTLSHQLVGRSCADTSGFLPAVSTFRSLGSLSSSAKEVLPSISCATGLHPDLTLRPASTQRCPHVTAAMWIVPASLPLKTETKKTPQTRLRRWDCKAARRADGPPSARHPAGPGPLSRSNTRQLDPGRRRVAEKGKGKRWWFIISEGRNHLCLAADLQPPRFHGDETPGREAGSVAGCLTLRDFPGPPSHPGLWSAVQTPSCR